MQETFYFQYLRLENMQVGFFCISGQIDGIVNGL